MITKVNECRMGTQVATGLHWVDVRRRRDRDVGKGGREGLVKTP